MDATLPKVRAAVQTLTAKPGKKGKTCSLSELGEYLRAANVELPAGVSLSDYVLSNAETLRLSGPPSGRKVGLTGENTEALMLERVKEVLLKSGPMTTSELRLRLRAERRFVPGLSAMLRAHKDTFALEDGAVRLIDADASASPAVDGHGSPEAAAESLVRLLSLNLPRGIQSVALEDVREVVLLDLDNKALLALEAAARRACTADDDGVLLLAFSSSSHNPRLPRPTADQLSTLAATGRCILLTPKRDCTNAADFVMAFWVGWLHANTRADTRFVLVSEDASLRQSVVDLLKDQGRTVSANLDPWDAQDK